MIIALDFDGTCVSNYDPETWPAIGREIGAAPWLRRLRDMGCKFILYTMRSNENLQPALSWFGAHEIPLFGINENPEQSGWSSSPKPYAHIYIDDSALGAPLKKGFAGERPYIDWAIAGPELVFMVVDREKNGKI